MYGTCGSRHVITYNTGTQYLLMWYCTWSWNLCSISINRKFSVSSFEVFNFPKIEENTYIHGEQHTLENTPHNLPPHLTTHQSQHHPFVHRYLPSQWNVTANASPTRSFRPVQARSNVRPAHRQIHGPQRSLHPDIVTFYKMPRERCSIDPAFVRFIHTNVAAVTYTYTIRTLYAICYRRFVCWRTFLDLPTLLYNFLSTCSRRPWRQAWIQIGGEHCGHWQIL